MSTFIGNLIGFAIIVWLVVKFVVPLLRKLMKSQQDAIRTALEESKSASDKLANADQMHAKALEDAKTEAAKVTVSEVIDEDENDVRLGSKRAG